MALSFTSRLQFWYIKSQIKFVSGIKFFFSLLIYLLLCTECQSNQGEKGKDDASLPDLQELVIEKEDQDVLPEIESESALDGELGKRLNQMVPVPVSLPILSHLLLICVKTLFGSCGHIFHVTSFENQFIV